MTVEFLQIDQYPHNIVIQEASLNVSELEMDVRVMIQDFTKRHRGYGIKGTPSQDACQTLMSQSNLIAQRIYDYYVDVDDQEVEIDQTQLTEKEVDKIVDQIVEEKSEEGQNSASAQNPVAPTKGAVAVSLAAAQEQVIDTASPAAADAATAIEEKEPQFKNDNERALYLLFKAGKTSDITKAELKEKGFNTGGFGPLSIRGCKIGNYQLYKEPSERNFNLKQL